MRVEEPASLLGEEPSADEKLSLDLSRTVLKLLALSNDHGVIVVSRFGGGGSCSTGMLLFLLLLTAATMRKDFC